MLSFSRIRAAREILNLNHIFRCPKSVLQSLVNLSTNVAPFAPPYANTSDKKQKLSDVDLNIRFVYPEFLPDPDMNHRNPIREKLERSDMLKRRANIELPEFYVGSVLAVTSSNVHAPEKTTRFVGICILRSGCGLRANFVLRNTVDNMGINILYELYDPKILKIEVLRLEKRLDSDLLYLLDAEPEFTTFPFDMEPEYLAEGQEVPVNPLKVRLKPRPWKMRYQIKGYKGIEELKLPPIEWKLAARTQKFPEEEDLMKQYRKTIPEEEQREIYAEVRSEIQKYEIRRRKVKRRTEFVPPTKLA